MKKNVKKALLLFCMTVGFIGAAGLISDHFNKAEQAVEVVSEKLLVPGGQSVGIRMSVKGVLVVGLEEIETEDSVVSPGYDAGLQIGDMILSVNGQEVYYADEVTSIVEKAEGSVKLQVSRKDEIHDYVVEPVKEHGSGQQKIGVWVKEKIAGIGTLSFYDPDTNVFAALGHGIYESKTGTLVEAADGKLLRTEVKSIKEGEAGVPGEIRGIFYEYELPLGEVKKNCEYGIYSLGAETEQLNMAEPMIMATQDQIEEGPAYILTTIDGDKVERFEINVSKVNRQREAGSKGLEIEVTDKRLLAYCGGIVQGMSGSPIIQNNRIIGAVTHVFVNNPTKGYGVFAEWMVEEGRSLTN